MYLWQKHLPNFNCVATRTLLKWRTQNTCLKFRKVVLQHNEFKAHLEKTTVKMTMVSCLSHYSTTYLVCCWLLSGAGECGKGQDEKQTEPKSIETLSARVTDHGSFCSWQQVWFNTDHLISSVALSDDVHYVTVLSLKPWLAFYVCETLDKFSKVAFLKVFFSHTRLLLRQKSRTL